MKKISLLFCALCASVLALHAVPAPTNVHWEGGVIKWELPALTDDSVYRAVTIRLYTKSGVQLQDIGTPTTTQWDFSTAVYHGRTYYATVQSYAKQGSVASAVVTSPDYTVPGVKDTLEMPDVTLTTSGKVSWGDEIGYMFVRVILQMKNGDIWEDFATQTTSNGWDRTLTFDMSTPGTYRAIVEGLQGDDVVRRSISGEPIDETMYTVRFDAQSLFANPDNMVVSKDSKIELPTIPDEYCNQKGDHIFYWSTDAAGKNKWSFAGDMISQDTTLYAQWVIALSNPVWDGNTTKWTLMENYSSHFNSCLVTFYTENDNEVNWVSMTARSSYNAGDMFFPGRKYSFTVSCNGTDMYHNEAIVKSALRTISGDVAVLPLENMAINPTTGKVVWDAPKDGVYTRHGQIENWNNSTQTWGSLISYNDANQVWTNTYIEFNTTLDAESYYRIRCQLNQGEYVIYEGELFYGNNPATGVDNTAAEGKAVKRMVNGQLLIEREGKVYNALGAEVK